MLSLWTVYDHPEDFPDCFVARRMEPLAQAPGYMPTGEILKAPTMQELRAQIPEGYVPCGRVHIDDPKVIEIWL